MASVCKSSCPCVGDRGLLGHLAEALLHYSTSLFVLTPLVYSHVPLTTTTDIKSAVMAQCRCVVASRTIMWLLLCFVAFGACVVGFISPEWLEGTSSAGDRSSQTTPVYSQELAKEQKIGPLKQCRLRVGDGVVACVFLTWESFDSAAWKSSVILQGIGTTIVFLALLLGSASFWKQNIGRFNIVSVAGLLEGVAGMQC